MFYRLRKREIKYIGGERFGLGLAFGKRRENNFKSVSLDAFICAKMGT